MVTRPCVLTISLLITFLAECPSIAETVCGQQPWPTEASLREWGRNTAEVYSAKSSMPNGLGLIVGSTPGEIWIAVPAHVVYGAESPSYSEFAPGLAVTLFGQRLPGALCEKPLAGLGGPPGDITFVCVRRAGMFPMFNESLSGRAQLDDEVRLLGKASLPGEIDDSNTATIQSVLPEPVAGADILTTDLAGEPSQSGALAYSRRGVIGLYLKSSPGQRSEILSMATIRRLAASAEIPWSLSDHEFYDCSQSRSVCATYAPGSLEFGVVLTNVFTGDRIPLESRACRDVPEGKYSITTGNRALDCEPQLARIFTSADPLHLNLTCGLNLAGASWISEETGALSCMPRGSGAFDCMGLQHFGMGWFQAVANVHGTTVRLIGRFTQPDGRTTPITGELVFTGDSLTGTFRPDFGDEPISISLRRKDG
jgi:hypothetical protein